MGDKNGFTLPVNSDLAENLTDAYCHWEVWLALLRITLTLIVFCVKLQISLPQTLDYDATQFAKHNRRYNRECHDATCPALNLNN